MSLRRSLQLARSLGLLALERPLGFREDVRPVPVLSGDRVQTFRQIFLASQVAVLLFQLFFQRRFNLIVWMSVIDLRLISFRFRWQTSGANWSERQQDVGIYVHA